MVVEASPGGRASVVPLLPNSSENFNISEDIDFWNFSYAPNEGNGDCLFLALRRPLQEFSKSKHGLSVEVYRYIVARSYTYQQYQQLCSIYRGGDESNGGDPSVRRDYGFMRTGQLSLGHYRDVVMTNEYWGDELALTAYEDFFAGIRFVVVRCDQRTSDQGAEYTVMWRKPPRTPGRRYVLLLLQGQHYTLIYYRHPRYRWAENEKGECLLSAVDLPQCIRRVLPLMSA